MCAYKACGWRVCGFITTRARTCVTLGTILARGTGGTGRSCRSCRARRTWLLRHFHQVVHISIQAGNLIIKFFVPSGLPKAPNKLWLLIWPIDANASARMIMQDPVCTCIL
jgi:hypothetical protein